MKRKIISKTYLRDISKYRIKWYLDEEDCYVSVKKLVKVEKKFVIHGGLCVMDDGYYVLEIVPKNENYAMRLFLDDKQKPLEYYFDICKNNCLDKDTLIPCYDDLYLDITYLNGEIRILDKEELDDALERKDITQEDYELTFQVRDKLLAEIKSGTNRFLNMDYSKYLEGV